MVNFQDFPNEIIAYIVTFLKACDILRFSYVSNQMYSICENDFIWKTKIKKDYPSVNINSIENYKKAYFKTNFTVLLYTNLDRYVLLHSQNIGKNAYSRVKNNYYKFCYIHSTALSDSKEEEKNKRKRTCRMLQEICSYKDSYKDIVITKLMENNRVQLNTTTHDNWGWEFVQTKELFFYSEEINRDLKDIYLLVSYYIDASKPFEDEIIKINMTKFFKCKEEIEEWLEKNLSTVSKTIIDLKETKEYEYKGRGKLPYSEQVHKLIRELKNTGSFELYYGHPLKDFNPFDCILVLKIPVCEQEKDENGFIFSPSPL